jgi:hypothetical protein
VFDVRGERFSVPWSKLQVRVQASHQALVGLSGPLQYLLLRVVSSGIVGTNTTPDVLRFSFLGFGRGS